MKPSAGIGYQLCKGIQVDNTNFARCLSEGKACLKTIKRRYVGVAWRLIRVTGRAMFMLGRLYHTGHGVPRDVVRAHMWYNLAAAYGYEEGKKWRDRLAAEML